MEEKLSEATLPRPPESNAPNPNPATDTNANVSTKIGEKARNQLKGLSGIWLIFSAVIMILIALTVVFANAKNGLWTAIFGCLAVVLVAASNFWLKNWVTNPLLGLGDTAKRISEGSYGILAERLHNDEIGELTDVLNKMSVTISEAERTQAEFISSVSHELRTPLTAIKGWGETLQYEESIEGDARRGLNIICSEAGRLTNMVEELLEFSRIRDGRFTLNLETVDVARLLDEVMFTYTELLKKDSIELLYTPPKTKLPEVTGDPRRLKQVILNILDNAVKYAKSGKRIELGLKNEGEYVVLTVRDFGPGIRNEDLPHVKERFYKGKSKERGSGIGLAVCDEIVARHGGKLEVFNHDDGGAILKVSLPIKTQ